MRTVYNILSSITDIIEAILIPHKYLETTFSHTSPQVGIHYHLHITLTPAVPNPIHQILLLGVRRIQRWPTRNDLQKHYPEGVNVRFIRQLHQLNVFRIQIPHRPPHRRAHMAEPKILRPGFAQPKVRNFGHPILIQQYVRRLHIAVDDRRLRSGVEIMNPLGRADAYLEPSHPWNQLFLLLAVKVVA
ncbi:hypothetical protein M5K25_013646 [Dendrobium thyrsiflorum]|uniref:Uncharacterized protein n=1 Tax=Dendrobium thyrsiflorum TaxID=117978 RepID=A0ABD0UTL5_DENTH